MTTAFKIIHKDQRLKSEADAAHYCGLTIPLFRRLCPVPGTQLADGKTVRWDTVDLDAWIDMLTGKANDDDLGDEQQEMLDALPG